MSLNIQLTALYTHLHHEVSRMMRIPAQIFLPSMVTTLIYFLIFGEVIGERVGNIEGVDYKLYITPGLLMINVVTNSYINVSSSLFSARFQRSVDELVISPMYQFNFLLGYVLGGVIRGLIIALIVIGVSCLFIDLDLYQLPSIIAVVTLFSCLFSLIGFANGMLAKTFDDLSIIPTFVLSPLAYLGGVFYSINMLPPFWKSISLVNPIYYMIDTLRFVMVGKSHTNLTISITCILGLTILVLIINLFLLKKGVGLRD